MDKDCKTCAPAIKIQALCKDVEALKAEKKDIWARRDLDYEHWEEEVSKRAKTTTLITVAAIVATIVIALFSGIWHTTSTATEKISIQLKETIEKLDKTKEKIEVLNVDLGIMRERLETHMRRTEFHQNQRNSKGPKRDGH